MTLLVVAMVLSAGVAFWLTVDLLVQKSEEEEMLCLIGECVWIGLWILLLEIAIAAVAIVVLRLLARRISRPVEKFAAEVDELVRTAKTDFVVVDTNIAELNKLATAFNRLQYVRARQSEEIRNLARNVLHDLRAPITNIYNESDRLSHALIGSEEAAAAIMSKSRLVLRIIDTNAEISRNYSGCEDEPAASLDLSAIVRESIDVYSAVAEEKGICLKAQLPDDPVCMKGHSAKLQRLVGNLVDNAIKFTPSGGSVRVELSTADDGIRLSVSDTGIGIPEEEIACIYERFYRCASARTSPGTGLGLSMVHSIVEFYAGTISCNSTPNSGTTFLIHFPREFLVPQAIIPTTAKS